MKSVKENEEMIDVDIVVRMRNESEHTPEWLWDRLRKFRQVTQAGISELAVSPDAGSNRGILNQLIHFSREMGASRLVAVLEDIYTDLRPGEVPRAEHLSSLYETYARTYAKLVLLIFDKD